jgi:hypothetical protein
LPLVIFQIGLLLLPRAIILPMACPFVCDHRCESPHLAYWLRWGHTNFLQSGLESWSFWSPPLEWLGLQALATPPSDLGC